MILGRCNNCSIDNSNNGYFGYYMSIDNCNPTGTCDVYINVLNKRHECPKTTSLTECLSNPSKLQNYIVDNTGRAFLHEYTTPTDIADAISRFEGIQGTEVTQTLLNRMIVPCGPGVSDFNNGSSNPGCFPYSDNVFDESQTCPNGNSIMYSKCCKDSTCTGATCNPCSVRIKYLSDDAKWKSDFCYYMCPSYWRQRIVLEGSGAIDESELCSSEYAELCKLSGCDIDPVCKIKWGGGYSGLHPYSDLDKDLCNGRLVSPDINYYSANECKNPTNQYIQSYCTTNKLCTEGTAGIVKKNPGNPRRLLPTVVVKKTDNVPICIYKTLYYAVNGNFVSNNKYSLYNNNGTIVFKKGNYKNFKFVNSFQFISNFYNENAYFIETLDGTKISYNGKNFVPSGSQKFMIGENQIAVLDQSYRTIGYLGVDLNSTSIPADTYPAILVQFPNKYSDITIEY
jgi:hypothetical protein